MFCNKMSWIKLSVNAFRKVGIEHDFITKWRKKSFKKIHLDVCRNLFAGYLCESSGELGGISDEWFVLAGALLFARGMPRSLKLVAWSIETCWGVLLAAYLLLLKWFWDSLRDSSSHAACNVDNCYEYNVLMLNWCCTSLTKKGMENQSGNTE